LSNIPDDTLKSSLVGIHNRVTEVNPLLTTDVSTY